MTEKSSARSGGAGIFGPFGLLFVALKLMGFIDWSWWWVTAPFWGGIGILLALMIAASGTVAVVTLFAGAVSWFRKRS